MLDLVPNHQPLNLRSAGSSMGLVALRDELASQGVDEHELLENTGINPAWFRSYSPSLSHQQRLGYIRNAQRLARVPETALLAGRRQRISDFGMYGYAMISSATFGEAVDFSFTHRELSGAVLRISKERRSDVVVFKTHHPQAMGPLLPFVTEFWRSTVTSLFSQILGRPFTAQRMFFPFPRPNYAAFYHETFNCPLHFNCDEMEWHLDAEMLGEPCPEANALTAKVCSNFCDRMFAGVQNESLLHREISLLCLGRPGRFPTVDETAAKLGMSRRTLFRRLKRDDVSYQSLIDSIRKALAIEYLESTRISVEEIAARVGFSDCSNFRKAFKRWTGSTPSQFRRANTSVD